MRTMGTVSRAANRPQPIKVPIAPPGTREREMGEPTRIARERRLVPALAGRRRQEVVLGEALLQAVLYRHVMGDHSRLQMSMSLLRKPRLIASGPRYLYMFCIYAVSTGKPLRRVSQAITASSIYSGIDRWPWRS